MHHDWDEQRLARLCSGRDRLAEDELYTRYAARLMTLCRRYTGCEADAQDLLQETFVKVLDRIGSFRYAGDGSLYRWIRRIAINQALNDLRRNRWRWVPLDFSPGDPVAEPTEEEILAIPQEKMLEWISRLPELRRAVFNLYCIDGYSHKEIGVMLGISEKGSAGVLAKARKQLKQQIFQYLKDTE